MLLVCWLGWDDVLFWHFFAIDEKSTRSFEKTSFVTVIDLFLIHRCVHGLFKNRFIVIFFGWIPHQSSLKIRNTIEVCLLVHYAGLVWLFDLEGNLTVCVVVALVGRWRILLGIDTLNGLAIQHEVVLGGGCFFSMTRLRAVTALRTILHSHSADWLGTLAFYQAQKSAFLGWQGLG